MKVDIIIPCYNAKDTLFKTLSSIAIQSYSEKVLVTLVNDCSEYSYQDFVEYFSSYFEIQEISTPQNMGPGGARNFGIQNTFHDYLLFIDSDDYLYDVRSIENLVSEIISKELDLVISDFIYERDNERIVKYHNLIWLHGKIYRRDFLEKNHILFNSSRANEDNGFNRLILLLHPKRAYYDSVTYVYSENENSITRKNHRQYRLNGLEGLTYNMNWAMKEAMQRQCDLKDISFLAMGTLVSMYFYYLELQDEFLDASKIFSWSYETLKIYQDHSEYFLSSQEIDDLLEKKEKEYSDAFKVIQHSLTFDEFLRKVGDFGD